MYTRFFPNENLARDFLLLFTIGVMKLQVFSERSSRQFESQATWAEKSATLSFTMWAAPQIAMAVVEPYKVLC